MKRVRRFPSIFFRIYNLGVDANFHENTTGIANLEEKRAGKHSNWSKKLTSDERYSNDPISTDFLNIISSMANVTGVVLLNTLALAQANSKAIRII